MASKLLLVIIPIIIAGIFGLATTMMDNDQGGESGDISVVDSKDTTIIAGDQNIIIENPAKLQEIEQNQRRIMEKLGIEPQIDQNQEKEISQEIVQRIEENRKEMDKIGKELENAGQKPSVDIDLLLSESTAYYYSGEYEKSIALVETVLIIEPNNVIALTNKGAALHNLGQYEEAITYLIYPKTLQYIMIDAMLTNPK